MEQRGGCCIARYSGSGGGGGGGGYDMSKVDRMMMRFRPIAPKPASPTTATTTTLFEKKTEPCLKPTARGKRKSGGRKKRKSASSSSDDSVSGGETVKTLSLLPEAPGVKEMSGGNVQKKGSGSGSSSSLGLYTRWLSFGGNDELRNEGHVSYGASHVMLEKPVVTSWVKVERVIDTWVVDGCGWYGAVGRTDEERVMGLGVDTCPGFVTEGVDRVRWVNGAYRRMVGGGGDVAVVVVVEKGVVIPVGCAGFTCRVRVGSKMVPCDVWRMDCGGFAWRLDTAAALTLGR